MAYEIIEKTQDQKTQLIVAGKRKVLKKDGKTYLLSVLKNNAEISPKNGFVLESIEFPAIIKVSIKEKEIVKYLEDELGNIYIEINV
jgi:hypothetical protein